MDINYAIENLMSGGAPNKQAIVCCLGAKDKELVALFDAAGALTKEIYGDTVFIRGIIEFSNFCRGRCTYCGINADNKEIVRYRMTPDEIVKNAIEANRAGYKTIVLQSGEDLYYTKEMLGSICREIKQTTDNMAITLSIGERALCEYDYLKSAGADRFLMKHETANQPLYDRLHPHSSFCYRIECQKRLKSLGYELGSGFMVGLPGQTLEILADDIIHLYKIKADMAGIGPFIPHEKTPLANIPMGSSVLTLKCIAVTRLLIKNINLPATTALSVTDRPNFLKSFFCGANVIMKKVEPHKYRQLYEIYPKKPDAPLSIFEERVQLEELLKSLEKIFI